MDKSQKRCGGKGYWQRHVGAFLHDGHMPEAMGVACSPFIQFRAEKESLPFEKGEQGSAHMDDGLSEGQEAWGSVMVTVVPSPGLDWMEKVPF
ncbi:hypothetical protein JCM17843_16930 [Kordiimonadales bacterium JCM 17843]|nr:hypothetical protein JCM17843_16930 [Kordiimonadales bacterium JCM 17843]